jgi:hypothetical protein
LGVVIAGTLNNQGHQPFWVTALLVAHLGICVYVSVPSASAEVTNVRRLLAYRLLGRRTEATTPVSHQDRAQDAAGRVEARLDPVPSAKDQDTPAHEEPTDF